MATEKQIAANRRNAQRSTGPRTESGKSISRCNSLRHGLTGNSMLLLAGEDPQHYSELYQALTDQLQPQCPLEELLVGNLSATVWRLRRAEGFEAAILRWKEHYLERCQIKNSGMSFLESSHLLESEPEDLEPGQEHHVLGRALEAVLVQGDLFAKLSRHEGHLMRQVERIMDQLRKLKSERLAATQTVDRNATSPQDVATPGVGGNNGSRAPALNPRRAIEGPQGPNSGLGAAT